MPCRVFRTALAASSEATPLQDWEYETPDFPAALDIGINADATGVLATVKVGGISVMDEGPVFLGTINVPPKDDEMLIHEVVPPGKKISVRLRDTSAAARVVMTKVCLTPI